MSKTKRRQAVVIGAGIAGLAAARVLSEYFEKIVVLERDSLPERPANRPGTPQSRHAHGLLTGGNRALDELFPGFEQDLAEAGAVTIRLNADYWIERPGYDPFPQRDLGVVQHALSRPAIEFAVRQRLKLHPNVIVRDRCRVRKLLTSPDGAAVTGVEFEDAKGVRQELLTELVVDASGRGEPTTEMLRAAGLPLSETTVIGVDQAYSTGVFHKPDDTPEWKAVITFGGQPPNHHRGGLLFPVEGNRWIVTLSGRHTDAPPGGLDGFLGFARGLRTQTIYNAVRSATLDGEIVRFLFPDNVLHHFERLKTFPRGLLPIGDCICRFNPVYAQGMTVAVMEAILLRELLAAKAGTGDLLQGLSQDYFERIPEIIEAPWEVSTFDFRHPATRGERPDDFEARVRFADALSKLSAEDPDVNKLSLEVSQLLRPRSALRDPALVRRVEQLIAEG